MKRLALLLCLLCLGGAAQAQVIILNDNMFRGRMSEVKATVLDSLTREPLAFASVYVVPSKDTTITNFTLTDAQGVATLDEVPYGSYVFRVEMMGYRPVARERYFREEKVDLGEILLQVDEHFLAAAVVSDVGNPIVVKKDTVEFNASSYMIGTNDMLRDLIKRMPGMEITENGKVKFNGQEIDKLTVGGRTFFFDDQSTALNNLPAAIVDKIRVIDRESEQTRATGVQDGEREQVLDVALKKEYEQGWFGNAALKGGTTLGEKDTPLRDDRGALYSANALVSAYTEKDQLTLIANGQNINDSNAVFVIVNGDERTSSADMGLSSAAQLGLNANTSRIKDVETTAGINYKYSDTDSGTQSRRTTHQQDGNLSSGMENTGKQYAENLSANVELKKETGRVRFNFSPGFRYGREDQSAAGTTQTFREGNYVNAAESFSRDRSTLRSTYLSGSLAFRELGGNDRRSIRLTFNGGYGTTGGERRESSVLRTVGSEESRALRYVSDEGEWDLSGSLTYNEPLGEKWTLTAATTANRIKRDNVRDAFDGGGRNDYYSSVSRMNSVEVRNTLYAQYKFGESSTLTFGGYLWNVLQETYSRSYGIEDTAGEGEWNSYVTPYLNLQHSRGNDRFSVAVSGTETQPATSRMLPVLNIANPSRLSLGNVYLKPYTYSYFSSSWTRNNRQRFSNLMAYLYGTCTSSPIGNAQWYDTDGILYSVPVNSRKPRFSVDGEVNYTTPLDAKKAWSLTVSAGMGYGTSVSYQARKALAGLDKDTFDYSAFMDDFWGNAAGDRFYSGQSGFAESRARTFNPYGSVRLKYNRERFSFTASASSDGRIARYSLDPKANRSTVDSSIGAEGTYTSPKEFEFTSDLNYAFYSGYAEGYGRPEWQWNAAISKNIGAFSLSVTVHDILNQTRNLTHTVTANYEEDTYRLVMGRYLLFGLRWNFGKMNAVHSSRAQQAAWNMAF
ncbi:MAG: outer membrane beta-barrel protein [Bacteroidales bacterium]|nr:outer membrane beta-barrel protein [Bacteroidales bacterium]